MTVIHLTTIIEADIYICFDAARDIKVHELSTAHTQEKAVTGRTSGLCEAGDVITWEATHFGIRQQLTGTITKMDRPSSFEDVMLKGTFKSLKHLHQFREKDGKTIMTDDFQYEVPFGIFGKLFNVLVLKRYMTKFLIARNSVLKDVAEGKSAELI
jgi:ligand-binding SRPBCC domain-containing protein